MKSPSWRGSEQSSPCALEVWASGLLRWDLRRKQRTGQLSTCKKGVLTNRPIREMHPEIAAALSAKTDLLLSRLAVDEHAKVTIENEAGKLYEASPWVADKRAPEIVRRALEQMADRVPPKSLAQDMAFFKLQSRILSAAEAV